MRSARPNAEEVRVRNNAEGLIVLNDAAFVVPLDIGGDGTKLRREREVGFEYARVLLWQSHLDFGPRFLVLPSRPPHLSLSL